MHTVPIVDAAIRRQAAVRRRSVERQMTARSFHANIACAYVPVVAVTDLALGTAFEGRIAGTGIRRLRAVNLIGAQCIHTRVYCALIFVITVPVCRAAQRIIHNVPTGIGNALVGGTLVAVVPLATGATVLIHRAAVHDGKKLTLIRLKVTQVLSTGVTVGPAVLSTSCVRNTAPGNKLVVAQSRSEVTSVVRTDVAIITEMFSIAKGGVGSMLALVTLAVVDGEGIRIVAVVGTPAARRLMGRHERTLACVRLRDAELLGALNAVVAVLIRLAAILPWRILDMATSVIDAFIHIAQVAVIAVSVFIAAAIDRGVLTDIGLLPNVGARFGRAEIGVFAVRIQFAASCNGIVVA